MKTIRAHFDGKLIIPDEPVDLPINTPLTVRVELTHTEPSGTAGDLANSELFGLWKDRTDIGDTLEFARELRRRSGIRGGGTPPQPAAGTAQNRS